MSSVFTGSATLPKQRISRPVVVPTPWIGGRHLARRGARVALLLLADTLLVFGFARIIQAVRYGPWFPPSVGEALDQLFPIGTVLGPEFPLAVLLCLTLLGAYGPTGSEGAAGRRSAAAALAVTLPAWSALWHQPTPLLLVGYGLLTTLLVLSLLLSSYLADSARRLMTPRRLRAARVLLVASDDDLKRAQRHPALSDHKLFTVRSVFDPGELRARDALEEFCAAIRRSDADTVVLCCGPLCDQAFSVVTDGTTAMGCGLVSLTRSARAALSVPRLTWAHGSPLVILGSPASRTLQLLVKRAVDVTGAGLALLMLAPLIALIALCLRLESSGPVLFGQRRIGAWGRPFRCLKFRTMRIDAEELLRNNPVLHSRYVENNYKLPDGEDPRITRIGLVLRKISLDELPQFWNVFRGDMSLIGPRPVVPDELSEYGETRRVLLSVKPGMSGAWAITGRSRVGYPRRAAIELRYVRRWRLIRDLSILWRTFPAVITRRGAH